MMVTATVTTKKKNTDNNTNDGNDSKSARTRKDKTDNTLKRKITVPITVLTTFMTKKSRQ